MEEDTIADKPVLLFKYGGSAMTDDNLKKQVVMNFCALKQKGYEVVIVHGGGPFIAQALKEAKIESEFIEGHRKTTTEALEYVEMALKGKVNGSLVRLINLLGHKAVGLSGKDGRIVIAKRRLHRRMMEGKEEEVDLGQVGDVEKVEPGLLRLLLDNDYIPVITCLASDMGGEDYNINADMFAGHIAGALEAKQFVVLTDVDGLLRDCDDPKSLIRKINVDNIDRLIKENVIKGGMIPKMESCRISIERGAEVARIINGTKPDQIMDLTAEKEIGTLIYK
jgi:acetylglutamate kinase